MERLRGDSMSGLFGIFNVSKRGLATQQKAIGVTSHNIANANTRGYSRQRAIIETSRPYAMPSIDNAVGPGQVGTGSTVTSIQRIRDEFLDYQVRNESSTMGKYEARDRYLSEVENIFNEPSEDGISTLVGKFFDSWQQLSKQPQSSNARTVVAQQSAALANELNHTYNQMQKLKENTQLNIKETVFNMNNMLNQLDQLNQQIIGVKINGQEPNDLMDRRDVLLDDLSKIFNIDIDKKQFGAIDLSPDDSMSLPDGGEKLLVRKEPNYAVSRFSYIDNISQMEDPSNPGKYQIKISYLKNGENNSAGKEITINNIDEADLDKVMKQIDQCRVMWSEEDGTSYVDGETIDYKALTNKASSEKEKKDLLAGKIGLFVPAEGELNGYMSVQQDVDKYVDDMNKLAKAIAFSVNAMHSGQTEVGIPGGSLNPPDADYMPFFVNKDAASKVYVDHVITNNTDLKAVLDAEKEITAGNISINEELLHDVMKIKTRTHDDQFAYGQDNNIDGETDGNRALAIAQIRDKLMRIQDINISIFSREDLFDPDKGGNSLNELEFESKPGGMTIDNNFKDIVDQLGVQGQEAKRMIRNQGSLLVGLEMNRESVSGVSLDEEMANMIQFQHAYQANAKVIATVDELLDVVVNGLKR
jgi:flagellar hook-associated protein 1 FlgK